jgi:hypothetical protein
MGQQLQPQQSADSERSWLSALIETMELVSQSQRGTAACDPSVLAEVRARLQRPALPCQYDVSHLSPPELTRRL